MPCSSDCISFRVIFVPFVTCRSCAHTHTHSSYVSRFANTAGRVEPVPLMPKGDFLGLGKAEEYEEKAVEATKQRRGEPVTYVCISFDHVISSVACAATCSA